MVPPALDQAKQEELKAAVQQSPAALGLELANWYWKAVRQFVLESFGASLSRSSCLNWLHRLGFAFKRPKKRLLKADEEKRAAFVAEYAAMWEESQGAGARIFFADEAHFRADAELRGKWVQQGEPALAKAGVEWMELGGNSNSGTSVAFLKQLPEATERKASWALEGDLGQCASPLWGGDAGIPADTESETATGESAGVQPGLQR